MHYADTRTLYVLVGPTTCQQQIIFKPELFINLSALKMRTNKKFISVKEEQRQKKYKYIGCVHFPRSAAAYSNATVIHPPVFVPYEREYNQNDA